MVRGLLLRNALLPSRALVDAGLAAPAPLAFNLSSSSNASLVLDSCTVATTCSNLAQFAAWVSVQQLQPFVGATLVSGGRGPGRGLCSVGATWAWGGGVVCVLWEQRGLVRGSWFVFCGCPKGTVPSNK